MELPNELRIAIERITFGETHTQLVSNSQKISDRYRNNSGGGERLLTQHKEAIAYSAVRMPATFGAVSTALQYALELSECNPVSLMDVGAGTGAAAWAANDLLKLQDIVCLEREDAMIKIGEDLMKESSGLMDKTKWVHHNLIDDKLPSNGDIVIASYVLNEMNDKDRIEVIKKIWDATKMMLLIVEPGNPAGYKQFIKNRHILLELGAHLVAPCPHEDTCKINESDWCHFKCRIPRSRLHRQLKEGEVPYEDEKFTYLAVTREKYKPANARIIRHPYFDKGRVTLDVCRQNGISKVVVSKKDTVLFKQARKAKCGDLINLEH